MKRGSRTLRCILLTGWVLGILLPLASFRRFSPSFRAAFDRIFCTEASHVLMHTFLYGILVFLIASVLLRPTLSLKLVAIAAFLVMGVIAFSQEAIQMLCEHSNFGSHELFDWLVDANAGLLGAMIFIRLARRSGRQSEYTWKDRMQCNSGRQQAVPINRTGEI